MATGAVMEVGLSLWLSEDGPQPPQNTSQLPGLATAARFRECVF